MTHDSSAGRRKGKTPQRRPPLQTPGPSHVPARRSRQSGLSEGPAVSLRKRSVRRGTKALMEIHRFQESTDLLLKKKAFSRVVREVCQSLCRWTYRWKVCALLALQEAAEAFLVDVFSLANLCAIHAKRVTVFPRDIKLALKKHGLDKL